MNKIEIYEDSVKISQLTYLYPYLMATWFICFLLSLLIWATIFESHNWEPTKGSCIEYFSNYTK
jgi:hypothetical protein